MVYFHILLTRDERLVTLDGFVIVESSRSSPSTLLTQRLIWLEIVALSLVLILILVFVRAVGDRIMIQISISFGQHVHAIHVRFIGLANHNEDVNRCKTDQNKCETSTAVDLSSPILIGLLISSRLIG